MPTNIEDLHRSRLEALLAVEIEFQKKMVALSNQRISEIKKLIAGVDEMHLDVDDDSAIASLLSTEVPPSIQRNSAAVTTSTKKKKKHKKATQPTKPIKLASGKPPRIIDAIQIVIRNKEMKAQQIYDAMKSKGWLPNSRDPLGYIRFTLSSEGEIFQRKEGERGVYHLDPTNPYYTGKTPTVKPPKQTSSDEVEPEKAPKSSITAILNPKEVTDSTENVPRNGSEIPPPISVAESFNTVDRMMLGDIPLD